MTQASTDTVLKATAQKATGLSDRRRGRSIVA
jgi:hypothetical protein